jgi:LL-diaminopimelate aminotransferase
MTTAFNGASNIAQTGGLACLDDDGLKEIDGLIDYYLENARILRETFVQLGYKVYGGVDAPYVFVDMGGMGSWEAFTDILEKIQVVTIPGAGFGPGGEGYLRMSAFAPRESCLEASRRFKELYRKKIG